MPYDSAKDDEMYEEENPGEAPAAEASAPGAEEAEAPFGADEEAPLEEEFAGEEEAGGEAASLEDGVAGLIENWQPTTPEGEEYKQDLQALFDQFGMPGGEEGGLDLEEGGLGLEEGPIPTGDLAGMRNLAAGRRFA